MIHIYLDIPTEFEQRVRSTLAEIALRWNIPICRAEDSESCDLLYSSVCPSGIEDSLVWIPFDPILYQPETECVTGKINGLHYWTRRDAANDQVDLIAGIWRLLALLDESQVPESARNSIGVFNTIALPDSRRSVLQVPLVEEMAELLLRQLTHHRPALLKARQTRWPGDKKWVFLLTSDADSINLGDWRDLAFNFVKLLLRRKVAYAQMLWAGLCSVGRLKKNPYFAFERWEEWLSHQGIPNTFYLFIQPKGVPRHLHDCRTSVDNQPVDWSILRRLAASGFEFGLHPSIRTLENAEAFVAAKQWLETHLEHEIFGLRHHYLALDWRNPTATFKRHSAAGFAYDATIAYRDTGGFKAGTCLPYRPFDSDTDRPIDLIEIPFCLMDSNLSELKGNYYSVDEVGITTEAAIDMAKYVRSHGGMVHLNWHQETIWNRGVTEHFHERLCIILKQLSLDDDCWKTTPREVAKRWKERYYQLVHW